MKKVRILLGIIISFVFLFLVLHKIDFVKLFHSLKNVNINWIPLAICVYILGVFVRTIRWAILIRPVKKINSKRLFPIYVISYMANNVLPLRIGDIYRAYIVGKKESISKSAALITIGIERIFDGLTMLTLLFLSVLFFPVDDPIIKKAIQLSAIVFLVAIILCYVVVLNRKIAEWIFNLALKKTPEKWHDKLRNLFDNIFIGLNSLTGIKDLIGITILSFLTWIIESVSYLFILWGFGFWGPLHIAISTMALVNLMIIIPSAPGYFGPFELACIIILGKSGYGVITNFTKEMATAFALVLHVIVQWIPSTLLGLIFMWTEHITFKEVKSTQINRD